MKVVYTFQARQDLKNLYAYIAYTLLAPEAAEKLINEIIQNVNTLVTMPKRNPLYRDEPWYSRGVRYLPVRKYLVFYTVSAKDDTVFVSRILYGANSGSSVHVFR